MIVEVAAVDRHAWHARKGRLIARFQPVARIGVVAVRVVETIDAFTDVFTTSLAVAASLFATKLALARRRWVGPALSGDRGTADSHTDLLAVAIERILA